jgi:hypothetical protein
VSVLHTGSNTVIGSPITHRQQAFRRGGNPRQQQGLRTLAPAPYRASKVERTANLIAAAYPRGAQRRQNIVRAASKGRIFDGHHDCILSTGAGPLGPGQWKSQRDPLLPISTCPTGLVAAWKEINRDDTYCDDHDRIGNDCGLLLQYRNSWLQ